MEVEKAEAVRNTLEELVSEGKIRSYGWSTDSPTRAEVFAKGNNCSSIQFSINFTRENPILLKMLDDYKLGGLIRTPFGMGLLLGKYNENSQVSTRHYLHRINFKDERMKSMFSAIEQVKELLKESGRTLPQAAIGYLLAKHESIVPIPGFKNQKQVEENAKSLVLGPLSKKNVKEIDELFSGLRMDMGKVS